MRILFEFYINSVPVTYRLGILSIIKEMIKGGSIKYYKYIFEENKREMKPFSHATYIQNLSFNGEEINGEKLKLTVSSPSYEFIMHLMNGSQRKSTYNYKGYEFELVHKRLLPTPPEFSELVTFKSASPILIEDKEKQPLLANDPRFEKEFNYYASLIAKQLNGRSLFKPIKINNCSMKKVVIKETLHQSQDKNIYITANHGKIQLKGHTEDLKMVYECGIGLRRSLGLGLLNIEEVIY